MGSIAELLGYSLTPEEPEDTHTRAQEDSDRIRETAMAAVLDETSLEPEAARANLRLVEDLDLDDLVLYAIIARIEHELHIQIPDASIAAWTTIEDLLTGVEAATR